MAEIPNTESVTVAKIAAALEIASAFRKGKAEADELAFEAYLERFLEAYKAIREATR